jgi:hypothetical protein
MRTHMTRPALLVLFDLNDEKKLVLLTYYY